MELREIRTEDELMVAFHLMVELRPHLNHESFHGLYRQAKEHDGYTLVGAFEGTACAGLMGYRVLYDFVHGKHLYIDDLVVSPQRRSQGIGAILLSHAETRAKELQCVGLRLCTGVENERGIAFYQRCGWKQRSVVFKKNFSPI